MKSIVRVLTIGLAALLPVAFVHAQGTTPSTGTSSDKPATASSPAARTDVYHVYFGKAVAGKAAQMADLLKTPNPKAPMPGHSLILRHQEGDAWDYAVIQHYGTKATVEAAGTLATPALRDVTEWHDDTFVNGPSWADFTRAMGISDDAKANSTGSVYVVSVFRTVPGHRDQLEKMLSEPPNRSTDTSSGNVLMQHLEGGAWNFLTIARYNSWQDFATNESNSAAQTVKNEGGWFQMREHAAFHRDTVTFRVAP